MTKYRILMSTPNQNVTYKPPGTTTTAKTFNTWPADHCSYIGT